MATRDHRSKDADEVQEVPPHAATHQAHVAVPAKQDLDPTLEDAFYTLCAAMGAVLEADDMVAWTHCQEIQAWMVNAGTDANGVSQQHLAWAHAVQLLEQVLGYSLHQH